MKKLLRITALFVALATWYAGNAGADLIRGDFAGTVHLPPQTEVPGIENDSKFVGQVVYDTDAFSGDGTPGDSFGTGIINYFSMAVFGITDTYSYSTTDFRSCIDIYHPNNGDYSVVFDSLAPGKDNFIGDYDLEWFMLILSFKDTYINDANAPLIMPDADNFIPGYPDDPYPSSSKVSIWGENPRATSEYLITSLSLTVLEPSQPVPEPATILSLLGGLGCLGAIRRRKRSQGQ